MLLTTRSLSILSALIIPNLIKDAVGTVITTLDVPHVVRNGTGPVDLSCLYKIAKGDSGLVIKWYHRSEQIYQWIPPMPPQDVGIISGLTEYPKENLRKPNSRSIIRLKEVTLDMNGEFVCSVSTFQEEATKSSKMIVYVPETDLNIYISDFNDTHLNITCVGRGAVPRPAFRFFVEGTEAVGELYNVGDLYHPKENPVLISHAIIRNTFSPTLIECEISIPDTDYKRRERTVFYPTRFPSGIAPTGKPNGMLTVFTTFILIVVSYAM